MPVLTDMFEDTEVICGVVDRELDNSDDLPAYGVELHETAATCMCTIYDPTLT
ncbi:MULTISPECIES: hypothetical protein [Streptacidiphilus]|uniref:Uncharacterized protein n=2 Tax=Streptacidiphilus TaxID=228398 RepID=A0ABV6UID6_9ACTN|nr:hypothetical protein [Streptacidiphilus jeojiense]